MREVNRFFSGNCELDAVFDVSSMELYADGGTRNMSAVIYPDSPYVRIGISGAVRVTAYTFSP